MRVFKTYNFKGIKGFKLGRSLSGPPVMAVYCYVVDDLMMDTGFSHMQKEVLEIAKGHPIKRVFLTHHHEDHSGNAAALKQASGAAVYGHPLTVQKMAAPFKILPYQKYMWGKAQPLTMEIAHEKIETVSGDMTPVHTPGHSRDHTVYLLEKAGVLFSGDLYLADKIKFFRSNEDMGTQIASLKKILKLDFDALLCSHHPKLEHGKERIEKKLAFLEDLYGSIIMLWERGLPEKQIFRALKLKEYYGIKCFCFGDVSMINGVRSAVRHYESGKT